MRPSVGPAPRAPRRGTAAVPPPAARDDARQPFRARRVRLIDIIQIQIQIHHQSRSKPIRAAADHFPFFALPPFGASAFRFAPPLPLPAPTDAPASSATGA